jgi:hypothetical protein
MIVLEVAFVLINLAVPYWIWTSKSADNLPKVEHEVLRKRLLEIVGAGGGFTPCRADEVVATIDDLCEKSRLKFSEKEPHAFERAGSDVIFSCEVGRDSLKVQWFPEHTPDHDLDCKAVRDEMLAYAPTFVLNLRGQMRRIEYSTPAGDLQAAPLVNCRLKLKALKRMTAIPRTRTAFVRQVGHMNGDPTDWETENLICLSYDPHRDWTPWRKRYGL